jgi:GNAT superfamily N-acetyltransferase
MSHKLVALTLDTLDDLPNRCRSCVFWELDPAAGKQVARDGGTALEKEAWLSDTLLEWGSCGQLVYVDGRPAGYALFAPPAYVPRSMAFPTSPASADAVLLMTARVQAEFAGAGLGRMLLQAVVGDVARRNIRAVEAFGREAEALAGKGSASGREGEAYGSSEQDAGCLLPADMLRAVGFKTVRQHRSFPRLRLDIRSTASWREDVGHAVERIFTSITQPALLPR